LSELALVPSIEWAEHGRVADAGTHLAGAGEEVDGLPPFILRNSRLADDCMQMTDDNRHDLPQSGALRILHAIDDVARQLRKGLFSWRNLVDHDCRPLPLFKMAGGRGRRRPEGL
jgi:hypothetical protein